MATYTGNDYANVVTQAKSGQPLLTDIYSLGGNDTIYLNNVSSSTGGYTYVESGWGNDLVKAYFEGGNEIYLGSGNDVFEALKGYGRAAADNIFAGSGNDVMKFTTRQSVYNGDSGNDTFITSGYSNTMHGGDGNDTVSYAYQDSSSRSGLGVVVKLNEGKADTGNGHGDKLVSIENVTGTGARDYLYGSSVDNIIKGAGGADILVGRDGNDDLFGGSGNDDLYGDSGSDYLVGGSGNDLLYGGSGKDYFAFNYASESAFGSQRDVIKDFTRSQGDKVDLFNIDANTNTSANSTFKFIGGNLYSGTAGELRFSYQDLGGGHILGVISGDTDGDGSSDFQIGVSEVSVMYSSDFIL